MSEHLPSFNLWRSIKCYFGEHDISYSDEEMMFCNYCGFLEPYYYTQAIKKLLQQEGKR